MIPEQIERKWEYISRKCVKEGRPEAARLAREIDEALVEIYGEGEHTPEWKHLKALRSAMAAD